MQQPTEKPLKASRAREKFCKSVFQKQVANFSAIHFHMYPAHQVHVLNNTIVWWRWFWSSYQC